MKKKEYYNKRKEDTAKIRKSIFTITNPRGAFWNRGKALKGAMMMIAYGASNRTVQKRSGLSLRRIKVTRKMCLGHKKAEMNSNLFNVETLKQNPDHTILIGMEDQVREAMALKKEQLSGNWNVIS